MIIKTTSNFQRDINFPCFEVVRKPSQGFLAFQVPTFDIPTFGIYHKLSGTVIFHWGSYWMLGILNVENYFVFPSARPQYAQSSFPSGNTAWVGHFESTTGIINICRRLHNPCFMFALPGLRGPTFASQRVPSMINSVVIVRNEDNGRRGGTFFEWDIYVNENKERPWQRMQRETTGRATFLPTAIRVLPCGVTYVRALLIR